MARHALAEARSLAYHRAVAERLRGQSELIERVRTKLLARIDAGAGSEYSRRWLALLSGPAEQLDAAMCGDDEDARALRQATPFANLLTPQARWALWAAVRVEHERETA